MAEQTRAGQTETYQQEIEKYSDRLYNEDLRPLRDEERGWTTYSLFATWMADVYSIGGYTFAAGLFFLGLTSTLAVSFMLGIIMSLVALAFADRIEGWQFMLSLQLLPGLIIGLWASRRIAKFIDERWIRPMVLGFAIVAGITVVILGPVG